jgi:hypothetical protein
MGAVVSYSICVCVLPADPGHGISCATCEKVLPASIMMRRSSVPDERIAKLEACVRALLASASPRAADHPTMWDAWGDAAELLGEDRNRYRVPHAWLEGAARALPASRNGELVK